MNDYSDCIVLAVDDTEANIDILVETLGEDYELRVALDGESALENIAEEKPDLILLDIMMPGMDGYEVCRRMKSDSKTQDIPVIFLTAMDQEQNEAKGLALGAVDYVTKPFSPDLIKARVRNHLELKKHRDHLASLVAERTRQIELTQNVTICCLANLAETRDPETGGHIQRTQNYVRELARVLKQKSAYGALLDEETIDLIYKSAPLHDIGKVGVTDRILLKPGKLTEEEFEEMKRHTVYGRDTLRDAEEKLGKNSFLKYAGEIAFTHHEKWDGSGYPKGVSGNDIPVSGRLMAIADVYDALVTKRVYKPPFSHEKAVSIIIEGKGRHFDPDMVDAFVDIAGTFKRIAHELADSEMEKDSLN
ncbi:MAG: two-component system response regulator [Desulfobacter sp.]|nr:MAG: two-component system response regulator [Desulfobacter sp.]